MDELKADNVALRQRNARLAAELRICHATSTALALRPHLALLAWLAPDLAYKLIEPHVKKLLDRPISGETGR